MKPSIGRIVHFYKRARTYESASDTFKATDELRTYPAIILALREAEAYKDATVAPDKSLSARVDLQVFGYVDQPQQRQGSLGWNENIPFNPEPKDGHWSWPPKVQ